MFPWQLGWLVWENTGLMRKPRMKGTGRASTIQHNWSGTPGVCTRSPAPLHPLLLSFLLLNVSWVWIYPNRSNMIHFFKDTGRNMDSPPHPQEWFIYSFFIQLFIQTHNLLIHSVPIYWVSAVWVWHCLRCWGNSSAQGGFTSLLFISSCA